ncbi:MAG: ABC transporter ATP-binding protein [Acidimicrobiales bacterium]
MTSVSIASSTIATRRAEHDAGVPVIELVDVTKVYPSMPPLRALDHVNVRIDSGELVAILGPSGSGKSTLLHLMGTLDRPTSGSVRVTGLAVEGLDDRALSALRATRIGFVFQQFFLAEHQRVIDNVGDGMLYAGVPLSLRRERALEALERVGLGQRAAARPTELSGGERQRVAIARAIVGQPEIVFADEPTGNLDQTTGQSILDLFINFNNEGSTIVVVTHDRSVAARLPRQVELLDGHIIADGAIAGSGQP